MKLLNTYNSVQQQIFDYFGYIEDYVAIPLDDATDYYWQLHGEGPGKVVFADSKEDIVDDTDDCYCNEIYTQRFLPKWVYRGEEYTMIVVDTRTDGNKFLRIFDNAKEVTK